MQHPFMIKKSLNKLGIDGTDLNITKALYDKVTANTIPNSEKLSASPRRSGRRQHSSESPSQSN